MQIDKFIDRCRVCQQLNDGRQRHVIVTNPGTTYQPNPDEPEARSHEKRTRRFDGKSAFDWAPIVVKQAP